MPRKKKTNAESSASPGDVVQTLKHAAKRKNISPAGLEAQGVVQEAPKIQYEYNPHLPPVLRSAAEDGVMTPSQSAIDSLIGVPCYS